MVAVINTSSSLRAVLHYNEHKVEQKMAECLAAVHYPKEPFELTFEQKLGRLQKLASLNLRTKVNSVHISLNFDPSEQLNQEKLTGIAKSYMDKIGFEQQPFLVYQHHDAAHPHIHVVTTNIRADGSRISLHNLGKNQSEKARKEIEVVFGLVQAQGREHQMEVIKPAIMKAKYGKVQTKRAIAGVLRSVLNDYKFTSLAELNAVLNQYHVSADRGAEDSRTFKKGGLIYRILDSQGQRVGVPIKASDFNQKPTLKYLQRRFEDNEIKRQAHKARVKNAIDFALLKRSSITLTKLAEVLKKDGIHLVLRINDTGVLYGITYVDHRTKSVFNGSTLGKNYSANAMQQRCAADPYRSQEKTIAYQNLKHPGIVKQILEPGLTLEDRSSVSRFKTPDGPECMSDSLFDPVKTDGFIPHQLRKTKKKKQKNIAQQL